MIIYYIPEIVFSKHLFRNWGIFLHRSQSPSFLPEEVVVQGISIVNMEFPTLGKNCEYPDCFQLDFLPIKCKYCQKYFCTEHFLPDIHSCSEFKALRVETAESVIEAYKCSVPGCNKTELAPVLCNYCGLQICLLHRHQPDHQCQKLEPVASGMRNTKAVIENILSSADQSCPWHCYCCF